MLDSNTDLQNPKTSIKWAHLTGKTVIKCLGVNIPKNLLQIYNHKCTSSTIRPTNMMKVVARLLLFLTCGGFLFWFVLIMFIILLDYVVFFLGLNKMNWKKYDLNLSASHFLFKLKMFKLSLPSWSVVTSPVLVPSGPQYWFPVLVPTRQKVKPVWTLV